MKKIIVSLFIKFLLIQLKIFLKIFTPKFFKTDDEIIIKTHLINFTKYINRLIFDRTRFNLKLLYDPKKKIYFCEVGKNIYLNTVNTNRFFKISPESKIINQAENFVELIDKTEKKNIIDLGSNIGEFSIFFAKKYPNSKIISVEGSKINYDILKDNIEFNNVSNVILENSVIADEEKEIYITNDLGAENFIKFSSSENCEKTKSTTLSKLLEKNKIKYIDFIKIDIEGSLNLLTSDLIKLRNNKLMKLCHLEFAKNTFQEIEEIYENFSKNSEMFVTEEYSNKFTPINAKDLRKILQENLNLHKKFSQDNKFGIDILFKFL